jgi:hypothetical protein
MSTPIKDPHTAPRLSDFLQNNPERMNDLLMSLSTAIDTRPSKMSMQQHLHGLLLGWIQRMEAEKENL